MEPATSSLRCDERDSALVRWPVYLWDLDEERGAACRREMSRTDWIRIRPGAPHELSDSNSRCGYGVVVSCGNASAAAAAIKLHKQRGATVFCLIPRGGSQSIGRHCELFLAGADFVIDGSRPAWMAELSSAVAHTAESALRRGQEDERLRKVLAGLGVVAQSAAIMATFRRVQQIATVGDLPVLITGETGTGKESVARAIHELDPRRCNQRFLALNSATLDREMAESDLFGHRRGAFTGAERDRAGFFRAADGGVLLLDEVGELSLDLQARLLRVIEEQRLFRLGDEHEIDINVRLVAATNRNLAGMIERGEFRQDLYYRLSGLSIHVPPLRERPDDILPLVNHFLRKHGHAAPIMTRGADPSFIEALQRAKLPGNARQVGNIVGRALASLDRPRALEIRDLPPDVWADLAARAGSSEPQPAPTETGVPDLHSEAVRCLTQHEWDLPSSLRAFEQELLCAALEKSGGNRSVAAKRLGITRRSIHAKLRGQKRFA